MRKHIDAHEQEYIEETSEDGYGYRNLKLYRKEGKDQFNDLYIHICRTGKLEQYYTQYNEGIVYHSGGMNHFQYFVKNVAKKADDATEKAFATAHEAMQTGFWHSVHVEHHEEPRPLFQRYTTFGVDMNLSNNKKTWYGNIPRESEFWDAWKSDKTTIKSKGYWVKKMNYEWLLFRKAIVVKSMKDILELA